MSTKNLNTILIRECEKREQYLSLFTILVIIGNLNTLLDNAVHLVLFVFF